MPKASFATKDAAKGGFGMEEGNGEVIGSVIRVHQYPVSSKTGKQAPPFICQQVQIAHLEKDWNQKEDDEPEFVEYGFGRDKIKIIPGKDDCECKFHVGLATGPDDDNPKDMGHDVGTEGNCLFIVDENAKIHEKCKQQVFMKSLEEKGFKPEILGRGWAPDLVGLKAHFKQDKTGKFKDEATGEEKDAKCLIVDQIQQYPYDVKGSKSKGKGAQAGAAAGAGSTAAAGGKTNGAAAEESKTLATKMFGEVAKAFKGKDGIQRSDFQKQLLSTMTLNRVKVNDQKPVLEIARDDDQLVECGMGVFLLDPDTNTLNFNL